jgi:putative FmdB family regulatory protein
MTICYEYGCNHCGFLWEIEQSFSDPPKKKCPKCSKMTLERLISGGSHAYVRGEATTLGQQAERNTKKMGKELQQKATEKQNERLKDNAVYKVPEEVRKIRKMTPEQKKKWIVEGD